MFRKDRRRDANDGQTGYDLGWPSSERWNPHYNVPRNSLEQPAYPFDRSNSQYGYDADPLHDEFKATRRTSSYGRSKRDMDTHVDQRRNRIDPVEEEPEELSDLTHWLETLAELYMNDLDNRARWDPRWLNITRRERFEGLSSANVMLIDYFSDTGATSSEPISTKDGLALALQNRPKDSVVRVIMVTDLSRFVMGALGQMYSIDPEFWFEHLINSGYGASDSGLKLKNAVWLNWAERESRFRHRALPGIGQRTEWNLPRRTADRCWAHLHWGRLGLLHYLGRKGFHENEMEHRLVDGRWTMERDVLLNKYGRLVTAVKQAEEEKRARKRAKKKGSGKHHKDDAWAVRKKCSNVYRPYSTFVPLPRNPRYWSSRDLRVLAPEGVGYWQSEDDEKKTIILVFDPKRNMKHDQTQEITPSLTFMPRAMEFESYTDEELWRTADPGESYLDPPPPPITNTDLAKQRKMAQKGRLKAKKDRLEQRMGHRHEDLEADFDSDSTTKLSDYDEEYQDNIRADYNDPKPVNRDRDFARKYSLSTSDLVHRYLRTIATDDILQDDSLVPSILTRLSLDDYWQLLAELRLGLDHIDGDLGGDIHIHLVESIGTTIRQNITWMRSTLQELGEWVDHATSQADLLYRPPDLSAELSELSKEVTRLLARAEQTLNLVITSTALSQTMQVIDQTSGINKLTELAFFFLPLSFITAVFSMQVRELTATPPHMWTWGVCLASVLVATYSVRAAVRSPTVRIFAMHCRVTMLNRFTTHQSRSSSRRLNTVGNRAIAKFFFFFISIVVLVLGIAGFFILAYAMIFFGTWVGAIAVAIYFIVTRWPELQVIIPCFISIPISAFCMWVTWYWSDEIIKTVHGWVVRCMQWAKDIFPAQWTLDTVEDDDLAKEGVKIYGRQEVMLASL